MDLISLHAALFVGAAVVLVALPWPGPGRRLLLLAANFAFLWAFDPLAPAIFLGVSLLGWLAAKRAAAGARLGELLLLGAPLLVPLFLPKLPGLGGGGAAADGGAAGGVANVVGARMAMFIGASYFTLRALHVVLDARRTRKLHLGLFDFLVYNSFFPTTVAGPIERADHFAQSYARLGRPTKDDLQAGVVRLFQGLLKKVVLGGIALAWAAPITSFASAGADGAASMGGPLSSGQAWLALYAIALYAYFDFAGYSDMAIGVARLMGLRLAENFDNPYLRPSIAEFWRGWHLSLSFWIRDYLFLPLCGRSASTVRPHLAALGSMTLCGLWHAPNPGWVLWGFLHGAGLSVHQGWTGWLRKRFALKKKLAGSLPVRVVATALTFNFVALTWVFVAIDPWRLGPSLRYLGLLFGLG